MRLARFIWVVKTYYLYGPSVPVRKIVGKRKQKTVEEFRALKFLIQTWALNSSTISFVTIPWEGENKNNNNDDNNLPVWITTGRV